jgi:hypothetical protein
MSASSAAIGSLPTGGRTAGSARATRLTLGMVQK